MRTSKGAHRREEKRAKALKAGMYYHLDYDTQAAKLKEQFLPAMLRAERSEENREGAIALVQSRFLSAVSRLVRYISKNGGEYGTG